MTDTCGRSDCAQAVTTVSTWKSESGRLWETRHCSDHVTPVPPLPGFALVSVERLVKA